MQIGYPNPVATKEKANIPPEEAVRAVVTPVTKHNLDNRHRRTGGAAHAIEGETLPSRPVFTSWPRCRGSGKRTL
jgi:hypothetical protein